MRGLAVKTLDAAGGQQLASPVRFTVDGFAAVRLGDPVQPHGAGAHGSPTMAQGCAKFLIDGVPVCFAGDMASCGHPTTGRPRFAIE